MATRKVHPEPGFADRQRDHQRRRRRNQKMGALAVSAAILAVAVALFLDARGGPTTRPADQPSSTAPDVSHVATGENKDLSPDGTRIVFWEDPSRPRIRNAAPYVLQVWISNVDGSDRRKVWQRPGCCMVLTPDLRWSQDGSSIVITLGDHAHRVEVAAGGSPPMPSPTG